MMMMMMYNRPVAGMLTTAITCTSNDLISEFVAARCSWMVKAGLGRLNNKRRRHYVFTWSFRASVNINFVWYDISVPDGEISMKLDANIHVTISVGAAEKVIQGSEVTPNDHTECCNGEGHYSIRWRCGHFDCVASRLTFKGKGKGKRR